MPTLLLPELIDQIAWHLVTDGQPGLLTGLTHLPPFLLTSKHVYTSLSPGHALSYANGQRYPLQTKLYARLCEAYLDVAAVKRRWWGRLRADGEAGPPTSALTAHLINVVRTLRFYQRSMRLLQNINDTGSSMSLYARTIYAPTVPLHLTTTMLLCLEHDEKNMPLLFDVNAHMLVQMLMLKRLPEGREENDHGWFVENILNTLALWCFWYVSSGRATLESETLRQREWVIDLVLPFVVTPFRYASALSPPTHFTLPIPNPSAHPPHVSWTAHGSYPLYYTREHPFSDYQLGPLPVQSQQPSEASPLAGTNADIVAAANVEELEGVRGETFDRVLEEQGRVPTTVMEDGIAQGADSGTSRPRDVAGDDGPPSPVAGPSRQDVRDDPLHDPQPGPSNARAPSPPNPHHLQAPAQAAPPAAPHPQATPPVPPQVTLPAVPPHAAPVPTPYIPLSIRPRPTPVNSHLHPSTGVHVFWYSSLGLWRAERERVSGIIRGRNHVDHPIESIEVDEREREVEEREVVEVEEEKPFLGKGKKRERREMSHREARKRSRLDRPLTGGEWRPYGETPEQSGDEGSSCKSSNDEADHVHLTQTGDGQDVDMDFEDEARRAWEENVRAIEAEWAKQREEDEEREREEKRRRFYRSFLVHSLADEHEYDISARFPECASFDPLRGTTSPSAQLFASSTTPSPTTASPRTPFSPAATMYDHIQRKKDKESTPTAYNAYAPLRMLLPPASIPAKLIFLSRREVRPIEAPDPTRGVRGAPADAPGQAQHQDAPAAGQALPPEGEMGGVVGEQVQAGEEQVEANDEDLGEEEPVVAEPQVVEPADAATEDPDPAPAPATVAPPPHGPPPATPPPVPPVANFQHGPTMQDINEFSNFRVAKVRGYASHHHDMSEATSRGYDTEWARMVLCWRIADGEGQGLGLGEVGYSSGKERARADRGKGKERERRVAESPLNRSHALLRWRNGRVYERGMLTGLWQGKVYFPSDGPFAFLASTRPFPRNLAEETLGLHMRPMYVRFTEHGKVRVPGLYDDPSPAHNPLLLDDGDMNQDASSTVVHNKPVPGPSPVTVGDPRLSARDRIEQWADENMNNVWIEGRTGSLIWEDGRAAGGLTESETLLVGGLWGDGSTRDGIVEAHCQRERDDGIGEGVGMGSVAFCVPERRGEGQGDAQVKKYVYETYAGEGECAHSRMLSAKDSRSVRGSRLDTANGHGAQEYFYIHPGCLRCAERERVVKLVRDAEEKAKSEWRKSAKQKEERVDRERRRKEEERLMAELAAEAEKMFASHGLEMDDGASSDDNAHDGMKEVLNVEFGSQPSMRAAWSPIASHSRSPQHSRHASSSSADWMSVDEDTLSNDPLADYAFNASHLPPCEDGVEDTILTGDVDERHANAWGRFVYYGRVRPWDGLVGFIRLQILPFDAAGGQPQPATFAQERYGGEGGAERRHGPALEGMLGTKLFFYGYMHAGKTIVGNWRYTGIDATSATVESAFMISRRED